MVCFANAGGVLSGTVVSRLAPPPLVSGQLIVVVLVALNGARLQALSLISLLPQPLNCIVVNSSFP